jgi:hypothetical protein
MSEPTQIHAGDTWEWTRAEAEYPAGTWTLTYYLRNAKAAYNVTAAADGLGFAVSVAAATTAAYKPGRYDWIARVTDGTSVVTVGTGVITVLPNLGAAGAFDGRSHARIVLDALEAVIAGRATHDQSSYSIGNRSLSRMSIPELLSFRDSYRAMVASEERAARLASGGVAGKVMVRF